MAWVISELLQNQIWYSKKFKNDLPAQRQALIVPELQATVAKQTQGLAVPIQAKICQDYS